MTLDHAGFQAWLDRYVAAWKSYDREAVASLWSEGAPRIATTPRMSR